MIIICVILGLLLLLESAAIVTAISGPVVDTRQDIIENDWEEFLAWVQDARKIKSIVPPYETWTETINGTPHYVAVANEYNFWLWYLDYKWEKPNAATKAGSVS